MLSCGRDNTSVCVCARVCCYLFEQLQAVRVVVVRKVDDSGLAVVDVERLPQPPQGQIPLHGAPGDSRVSSVPPQLIVPGRLHVEVGVVQARFAEESRHQRRPALRVLHQDPVQVGDVEEGVGQPRQLRLLHRPAVRGGDDVDGGQHVGPGRRPRVHVLCSHHLHNVLIRGTVLLGVLRLAASLPLPLQAVICRFGDKKTRKALVRPWAALCICASGDSNPVGGEVYLRAGGVALQASLE